MALAVSALTRFDCTQFLYYNLLEICMGASSRFGLTKNKKDSSLKCISSTVILNLDESNQLLDKNRQNFMKLR